LSDRERVNRLDVVLKIADRCNLACPYCYYFYQENDLHRGGKGLIAEPAVPEVVAFLRRGAVELDIEHLHIGLHGGEPTLLPKARFDRLCSQLRDDLRDVTTIHFGMQTNGTLLDDEWVDIIAKHQVRVGVSIDGPPHIHDRVRPDHRGRGSYEASVRGLQLLQRAADAERIPPTGVLCVANPDHSGAEVVRHLVEDLGVRSLNLLLPREGHDSDVWKPQSKWISYFGEVIQYWKSATIAGRRITIRMLSEILTALVSETAARTLDRCRSNRHSIITITSQGHLGPDDNLMALDKSLCRGDVTIRNTTLAQLLSGPLWRNLTAAVDTAPDPCARCEWYRTCRSGDLFNRYSRASGFANPSVFCETLDFIHTSLAAMVTHRQGGVDGVSQILSQHPAFWARDYFSYRDDRMAPPTHLTSGGPVRLPVVK
jgi:uncharacterized protein